MEKVSQKNSFYVMDLETSKLAYKFPESVEIIQLALVRINPDSTIEEVIKNKFFNPKGEIRQDAFECHGMKKEHLQKFEPFTAADAANLTSKIRKSKGLIGHNLQNDMIAIRSEFDRLKKANLINQFPKKICTMQMARAQGYIDCSLSKLCKQLL